jgi:putative acetyltransferase
MQAPLFGRRVAPPAVSPGAKVSEGRFSPNPMDYPEPHVGGWLTTVYVRRERLDSLVAVALIGALNAELSARYPEEGATHFRLDPEEVAPGRGAFVVAYLADEPAGCGAVRRIEAGIAELKRMFVAPARRGQGVGRAVLEALEAEARALGTTRLVLETGVRQPEALALYERAGFTRIPSFGEYVDSTLSVCLAKDL